MNVSFSKYVLDSGWSSLQEEYNKSRNEVLFNNKCSNIKLLDSRDTDFNEIANRIAYMYKFRESVKILVETSISNFFKQCSEEEMIYFSNNGKICSLSNGPGLDIIGYLSALVKSNKQLNFYPILMGINLYGSWQDLFQRVTSVAQYCAKSYLTCNQNLSENVQFIQCDIFSALSNEAKECIKNSDILLMCKVFSSTKANPEIVHNTLKEILILLKPGSMIFFIASKRNAKNVCSLSFLKEFVEIKFGPSKVTLENVLLDAGVSDTTDLKSEPAEKSYFMVMQRTVPGKIKRKKRGSRGRKGKNKVVLMPSVSSCDISITDGSKVEDTDSNSCISVTDSNSCISVTDSNSCISVASSIKQFDITSGESKSVSSENVSHVGVAHIKEVITAESINKKELPGHEPHYTFQTKLKTFLNKNSSTEHSCTMDEPVVKEENIAKPIIENVFGEISKSTNSKNLSEEKTSSKNVLMEIIGSNSNSKDDSLNKMDSNDALSSGIGKLGEKFYNSNIEFEKPIQPEHFNLNEMTPIFQFSSPDRYIPPHKRSTEMKTFDESTFHMEQMKTVNDTDCLNRKRCLGSKIDFANESRKSLQEISKIDKSCENVFQLKKNTNCWEERKKTSCDSHKTFRDSSQPTIINNASFSENELKTKTERKQKETGKFSSENSFYFSDNDTCAKEFINTRNKNTMLERCEILVTSLEGLVANISKNVDLMNKQSSEIFCSRTQSCTKCRHLCTCSGCFYEQSCARKYCCRRMKNHVCINCSSTKSLCNRPCNHQMHACNYDVDKSRSSREPYLVLPIQNEDMPFILNVVSKNS